MKQRKAIMILTVIAVVLIAASVFTFITEDRNGPTISFSDASLIYTDSTSKAELLRGVSAKDDRDGDVSSSLRVLYVVPNDHNTEVKVEYIAKDRHNNMTRTSRVYEYSSSKS